MFGYRTYKRLCIIDERLERIMATLDQVLESVEAGNTVDDSIIALLEVIKRQLDDVLAGVDLPAGVQAKVDKIFTRLEEDNAKVSAAVLANTPVAEKKRLDRN